MQDLISTIDQSAAEAGIVTGQLQSILSAMDQLDLAESLAASDKSFVMYQVRPTLLFNLLTCIGNAGPSHSRNCSRRTRHDDQGNLQPTAARCSCPRAHEHLRPAGRSRSRCHCYGQQRGGGLALPLSRSSGIQVSNRLNSSIKELGEACNEMVQAGGIVQSNPSDSLAKKELAVASRAVMQNTSYVLAALQAGSQGTQACINAESNIEGFIVDLETTGMFAAAGTLQAEPNDSFAEHRGNVVGAAESMVDHTKKLVKAAGASQEILAEAADSALSTFTSLVASVKQGASSLGSDDVNAQVMLLNGAKDMAGALSELMSSTRNASGKSVKVSFLPGVCC